MNLLDTEALGERLRLTPDAVKQRRYRDPTSLPPAIRIGRSIRWDPETVTEWLKEREEVRTEIRTPSESSSVRAGGSCASE